METEVKELLKKISIATAKIESKYPELVVHIPEMPTTIPSDGDESSINKEELEDYLETLKKWYETQENKS